MVSFITLLLPQILRNLIIIVNWDDLVSVHVETFLTHYLTPQTISKSGLREFLNFLRLVNFSSLLNTFEALIENLSLNFRDDHDI